VLNGPAVNALEARPIPGVSPDETEEGSVHELHGDHAATD
jgi:hypothetical protein